MTEPVAYWHIPQLENNEPFVSFGPSASHIFESIQLYTSEQLLPRVKMTKKQYDRLMYDKLRTNLSMCLEYFLDHDGDIKFGLPSENLRGNLTQEDIARAWLNPEETIEIVPDMKWFVISKEPDNNGEFQFISGIETPDDWGYSERQEDVSNSKACAYPFDTKYEAEKWTNPLTEAVQLPVDGE